MILSFRGSGTEDIFDGEDSKAARKTLPAILHEKGAKTLDRLNSAVSLHSLTLPGLRLEKLKGDRTGQHSIRINDQYRVCSGGRTPGPRTSKSSTTVDPTAWGRESEE